MQIRNLSSSNNLSISVFDAVIVVDVFGALKQFAEKIILHIVQKVAQAAAKLQRLFMVFSNLNNHSSPPGDTVFNRLHTTKIVRAF